MTLAAARSLIQRVGRRLQRERDRDASARRFIEHNRRAWSGWAPTQSDRQILVDLYGVGETNIAYSYFLNVLGRRQRAAVYAFGSPARLRNRALREVYRSFNTTDYVATAGSREQRLRAQAITADLRARLRTKRDLLDLHVHGVGVGLDVYETYLRRYNEPTVHLDDPRLLDMLEKGIGLVVFWRDYFARHDVAAVVSSHDCYLEYGVVCRVAYAAGVPVYLPNVRSIWRADRPHSTAACFAEYRQMFRRLPAEERREALAWARERMARRMSGEVGVDMPYSTASAFGGPAKPRIVRESDRLKVLVCVPCFTDNPHGCGGLLFVDFWEWLRYLGEMSRRTNYDWYLKTHPDPLPVTLTVMWEFLREFPNMTLVPHDASHHQLAAESIDVVLTPYGSVGHEYPALGKQVVNAGYNTHAAYDFNWTPKSLEEYESWLLHLEDLDKPMDLEELHEFYYMQHAYTLVDDLVLPSYGRMLEELTRAQRIGTAICDYFLDRLTAERHRTIITRMDDYLASGRPNLWSRGPE